MGRGNKDTITSFEMLAASVPNRFALEAGAFVDFFGEEQAEDTFRA